MRKVVIINYGMGNIRSVARGIEHFGVAAILSDDPKKVVKADRVILPGVGAFEDGIDELRKRNLDTALAEFVRKERPLLGICLGMQMLFDDSEEHGLHRGLGMIEGHVKRIPNKINDHATRKIPHIGWSSLKYSESIGDSNNSLLANVRQGEYMYFVHSFMAVPDSQSHVLAECDYEQQPITALVQKDYIFGSQFHPEKSGSPGLKILNNYLEI